MAGLPSSVRAKGPATFPGGEGDLPAGASYTRTKRKGQRRKSLAQKALWDQLLGESSGAGTGDAAKDLGADFVIGVALSPAEAYRNTSFITASGEQVSAEQKGFSRCDVLLEPDLSAYSAGDVFAGSRMYDIGYECAQRRMPEILRLLRAKKIVFE